MIENESKVCVMLNIRLLPLVLFNSISVSVDVSIVEKELVSGFSVLIWVKSVSVVVLFVVVSVEIVIGHSAVLLHSLLVDVMIFAVELVSGSFVLVSVANDLLVVIVSIDDDVLVVKVSVDDDVVVERVPGVIAGDDETTTPEREYFILTQRGLILTNYSKTNKQEYIQNFSNNK